MYEEKMDKTEVIFGRTNIEGREVGHATWIEGDEKHKMMIPLCEDAIVKMIDGEMLSVRIEDTIFWMKAAEDIETEELEEGEEI